MQFYVLVNDEQQGPFSESQIKGYIAMGHFQPTDLAWHEGLPEWKPLQEFPQFAPKTTGHRTPNYKSVPVRNLAAKKAKKGNPIVKALVFVVTFGAAAVGGYYATNYFLAHRNKAGVAASAKDAGGAAETAAVDPNEPKNLEELNRWYEEPPAGQNAAVYFQQGFDALEIANTDRNSYSLPLIGKGNMPAINASVPGGTKTALKNFLEKNKAAMDLFERGAQCSGSRYPVDLTKGFNTMLPHLAKVKETAQIAELAALQEADAHQGADAAKAVGVGLATAETLQAEPLLISQLVRVACEGIAREALEQTINRVAVPADALARLQTAFDGAAENMASGTGFNRALVSERVNSLAALDSSPEKLREMLSHQNVPATAIDQAMASIKDQRAFIEETLTQALAARKEPFPGRLRSDEAIVLRVTEAASKQYSLAAVFLPALGKLSSREGVGLAHLRIAQTAIALERFRLENSNRYPDALTELAPKYLASVPNDPFDGQPMRYRKAGEGFVVYSVGPDLKDDNGMRRPGADDVSFILVRPAK